MPSRSDIQYRMKCPVCGKTFLVDSVSAKVPTHPGKGQSEQAGTSYVPCGGSGLGGIVAGTKLKAPEDL